MGTAFAFILSGKCIDTDVSLSVVSSAGSLLSFLAADVAFSDAFGLRQLLSSYLPLKRSEICFRISDILRSSSVTGSFSGRSFGVGPSLAGLADAARCV